MLLDRDYINGKLDKPEADRRCLSKRLMQVAIQLQEDYPEAFDSYLVEQVFDEDGFYYQVIHGTQAFIKHTLDEIFVILGNIEIQENRANAQELQAYAELAKLNALLGL